MDVTSLDNAGAAERFLNEGSNRRAALAEARQRVQAQQIAATENARESQAAQRAELRETIARALGANTRLSIERIEQNNAFLYRAIDTDTGEIVHEWPLREFSEFLAAIAPEQAGALVDQKA